MKASGGSALQIHDAGSEASQWTLEFLAEDGHDVLCIVPKSYFLDSLFLNQFSDFVPHFRDAMRMIIGETSKFPPEKERLVGDCARLLYAYAHASFVQEPQGLAQIRHKYLDFGFGKCPRILCGGERLLPFGPTCVPGATHVHFFCQTCGGQYLPERTALLALDGSFFGTSLPQLFLLSFPELAAKAMAPHFIPRIFGFRLYNAEEKAERLARAGGNRYRLWCEKSEGITPKELVPPHRTMK